jgi:hypothetical protein
MVFVNFLLSTGLLTNRDHRLTILLYRLIENKRSRCYYAPGKNGKATEKYEISQWFKNYNLKGKKKTWVILWVGKDICIA